MGSDPIKIPIANVIPGWKLGVMQMHEGETAMLGIPPDQAYGAEGTPDGRIPGGSTLVSFMQLAFVDICYRFWILMPLFQFFKLQLLEILTGGIGGGTKLLGADGTELSKDNDGPGLLGADGKPL
jgi:hypothetical protein